MFFSNAGVKQFHKVALAIFLVVLLMAPQRAIAWGFWAHQRINRMAVFTLPPEMLKFYKQNIEYLTTHAVDPDMRRYAVEGEAQRHYIDIDHYGENVFQTVPQKWKDAVEKFSEDTLQAYGIVPWNIQRFYYDLVEAFKAKDAERILKLSADLGHYIGDSNVPLHTTENYNGQMTGQHGIHGLWESRIPELYGEGYDYYTGPSVFLKNPLTEAWKSVQESNAALDTVLFLEKTLTLKFPVDKKYSYENRNNILTRVYSEEFCRAYSDLMNGMVERRLRSSIFRVGCFWFSAWVEAGQPDLEPMINKKIESKEEKFDKKLNIKDREDQTPGVIHSQFQSWPDVYLTLNRRPRKKNVPS